ncbi:MAG: hypothetical protein J6D30_05695 [Clostridia bacterium]|nr:hypothetical protein [Clostridia bacterium]
MQIRNERQEKNCRFSSLKNNLNAHLPRPFSIFKRIRLHPLFLLVGVWYAIKGELFLFLLSALVALQHECAHAFASAKLGYKLNAVVLMPYGAVIDGDLSNLSLKDEIYVAICGPLCNLVTALFFLALWWLAPTMYAFTDTAYYASLSIALLNLLPAYPLDGGRILRCFATRYYLKTENSTANAEQKSKRLCFWISCGISAMLLLSFFLLLINGNFHPTLLAFSLFLFLGARGNADKTAVYQKYDFSVKNALERGVEIRRVAVLSTRPIKDALRFLTKDSYLVLEVYDPQERLLFTLTQNQLSELFAYAESPYEPLGVLKEKFLLENALKTRKKTENH